MPTTTSAQLDPNVAHVLRQGVAIPAHPLALNAQRKLDERRQRALTRYYLAAGAGGLAVGVHTTQFEIRDPEVGLFEPVLRLAAEEMDRAEASGGAGGSSRAQPLVRVAGICGETKQAVAEAELARSLGYNLGLLSLKALGDAEEDALIEHCRRVAEVLPLVGFYLQVDVGGRVLPHSFWRRFAEIENVAAIKMAPFHRYRTIDVVRAVAESGRADIALYTGNDDNIIMDLLTPYRFHVNGEVVERRIVGGLLGHWAVWTRKAVEQLEQCHAITQPGGPGSPGVPMEMLQRNVEVTDANAAFFDTANNFQGVIAGIHEVLRRQGLLEGTWCLNPDETLGPGQAEEIDRVYAVYPHLHDDLFVQKHLDDWLRG